MVDRVHQRLAEPGDEAQKGRGFTGDLDGSVFRRRINEARWLSPGKISLDVRPRPCLRIPAWVHIAAIWLIPLLSLGVSYYLYRDARDVRQLAFYGAVRTFRQAGADHLARW